MAAEFTVVSQWLDSVDPNLGPVSEELRTLQVKRPASAVKRMEERKSWIRFGMAKGKSGPERGVTDVLKEDIFIEEANPLDSNEDDKIAHRLVATAGKVQITSGLSRYNSAGGDAIGGGSSSTTPSISRKNSGSTPAPDGSRSRRGSQSSAPSPSHSRSNSGALVMSSLESSLPQEPSLAEQKPTL